MRVMVAVFSFFCLIAAEPIQFQPNNTQEVIAFVQKYLPSNPIIVEAGAFDGTDSSLMAQFWPQGKIYAFEPVPELFEKLCEKGADKKNLFFYQKALGKKKGRSPFYLSAFVNDVTHVSASSSLLPPKEHLVYAPHVAFPKQIVVETVTLDDWAHENGIKQIDFLWLDVQGAELDVLKKSKLAKKASAIWVEVEFVEAYKGQCLYRDILKWMKANHFKLVAADFSPTNVSKGHYKEGEYSGNALFVKR